MHESDGYLVVVIISPYKMIANIYPVLLYAKSCAKHLTWILLTKTSHFIEKEIEQQKA